MRIKYKLIFTLLITLFIAGRTSAQALLGAARKDDGIESIYPDYKPSYVQKLIDTAIKNYPQLKVRAMQTNIATTTWRQSKASWFESLSITPSYVYNPSNSINLFNSTGASTNFFSGYQIAFSLSLSSFITRPYVTKNARQAIAVAQYEEETAVNTLKTQVKKYYVAYLLAQAQLRLATTALHDIQNYGTQVKHEFLQGTTGYTLTVYTSSLTAFNSASVSKLSAEAAVLDAKGSLEEFVGKRLEEIK